MAITRARATGAPAAAPAPGVGPAPAPAPRAGPAPAPPNITVQGAGLDTYIPRVKEPKDTEIIARFPHQTLTRIEGEPTYKKLINLREEMGRNALTAKVSFGGGKLGTVGIIYKDELYKKESGGISFIVPASEGAYPDFTGLTTNDQKKQKISQFEKTEEDILITEAVMRISRNMLLQAVEHQFLLELKEGMAMWDNSTVIELLEHLFTEYGEMSTTEINQNKKRFQEEPILSQPAALDIYYHKQQECQKISLDSPKPIEDDDMVSMLVEHMEMGDLAAKAYKFKNIQDPNEKTWTKAKAYFRAALRKMKRIKEGQTNNEDLQVNAAAQVSGKSLDIARNEIQQGLGKSFDSLAAAATVNKETIEENSRTISSLSNMNAMLAAENSQIKAKVEQMEAALARANVSAPFAAAVGQQYGNAAPTLPPGFPPGFQMQTMPWQTAAPPPAAAGPVAVAAATKQAAGANTRHMNNTDGVSCPVKRGNGQPRGGSKDKWYFIAPQKCKYCGLEKVYHVPENYMKSPLQQRKKAEAMQRKAAEMLAGISSE